MGSEFGHVFVESIWNAGLSDSSGTIHPTGEKQARCSDRVEELEAQWR